MQRSIGLLTALCAATLVVGEAHAATYVLSLQATAGGFSASPYDSSGQHVDRFTETTSGLDSTNSITVAQGDVIDLTTTFDTAFTIPASGVRTDILQYLSSSTFPSENTGVTGTFTFFNAGSEVATFGYGSTTSSQLSSFKALFAPSNGAITFTSFTNDFTINTLASPATLDGSSIQYDLVSNDVSAAPEPSIWGLMLAGVALIGLAVRRRHGGVAAHP